MLLLYERSLSIRAAHESIRQRHTLYHEQASYSVILAHDSSHDDGGGNIVHPPSDYHCPDDLSHIFT